MLAMPESIPVPLRVDDDGVIRVGNTRVTLITLVQRFRAGDSPEELHEGFPSLWLSEIYAVIAYYLDHREEVDAYIANVKADAERWRQAYETDNPKAQEFNARMRALLQQKHNGESA